MTKFKVGDRVRVLHGKGTALLPENAEREVIGISDRGYLIIDPDLDTPGGLDYEDERFELIERPAAPAFKVGDRARAKIDMGSHEWSVTAGTEGILVGTDDVRWDGWQNSWFYDPKNLELITPATDELAELRAWKDAAIAKHPDLAPVEPETDDEAAERLALKWSGSGHVPVGLNWTILEAFKWARANPR